MHSNLRKVVLSLLTVGFVGMSVATGFADGGDVVETGDDSRFKVIVDKVDDGDKSLKGASLSVMSGEKEVANWTSDGYNKELMLPKGDYVIREKSAPEGYISSGDIKFNVDVAGNVKVSDGKESDYRKDDVKYIAYRSDNNGLFVKSDNSGSEGDEAYCFNKNREIPPGEGGDGFPVKYTKHDEDRFRELASNPADDTNDNLVRSIKKVIYTRNTHKKNGFADEKENLIHRKMTQLAIWHYTDSVNHSKDDLLKMFGEDRSGIYYSLINSDIDVPANFRLNIFESDNPEYQNVLSTTYIPGPSVTPSIKVVNRKDPDYVAPADPVFDEVSVSFDGEKDVDVSVDPFVPEESAIEIEKPVSPVVVKVDDVAKFVKEDKNNVVVAKDEEKNRKKKEKEKIVEDRVASKEESGVSDSVHSIKYGSADVSTVSDKKDSDGTKVSVEKKSDSPKKVVPSRKVVSGRAVSKKVSVRKVDSVKSSVSDPDLKSPQTFVGGNFGRVAVFVMTVVSLVGFEVARRKLR